jgi:L-ascorbate metabolism protein UlaG (beta-lactamase superfamily)
VLLAGLASAISCHLPIERGTESVPPGDPSYDTTVQVRFLGVGGFLIRRGEDVVLTAPLYSNPELTKLDGVLLPNPERIRTFNQHVSEVDAVLVGHAHYDHLMDVPLALERSKDAMIYGNESVAYILTGYTGADSVPRLRPEQIKALNLAPENLVDYRMCVQREGPPSKAPDPYPAKGDWVPVPRARVRIRALCSEHPAQIAKTIHQWPGRVYRPRFAPPQKADDYQEGETLAFLIDFLDEAGTKPVFRIYYQDAPTPPTIGEVAPDLLAEKPVDVAILCAGNFLDVEDPGHIVRNTRPHTVVLGHWENFFMPQRDDPPKIPGSNVKKILEMVRSSSEPGTRVILPNPQAMFVFPVGTP